MKIHLIRSDEISKDRFRTIYELVNQFVGPVKFVALDEDIRERRANEEESEVTPDEVSRLEPKTRESLFGICESFRKKYRIKADDAVVLLTDYPNQFNWFSAWDPSNKRNFFVQTSYWEYFTKLDSSYPIVYELISIPLYLALCKTNEELLSLAHHEPKEWGCPFDLCANKIDIQRKLHSGDICPECRKLMIEKNTDPFLARQFFAAVGKVREQLLFNERLCFTKQPSRLTVSLPRRNLVFNDLGNFSIHLGPKELAVYVFFMNHPEVNDLREVVNFKNEIYSVYKYHAKRGVLANIGATVDSLVNNEANAMGEVISRINKKI